MMQFSSIRDQCPAILDRQRALQKSVSLCLDLDYPLDFLVPISRLSGISAMDLTILVLRSFTKFVAEFQAQGALFIPALTLELLQVIRKFQH